MREAEACQRCVYIVTINSLLSRDKWVVYVALSSVYILYLSPTRPECGHSVKEDT